MEQSINPENPKLRTTEINLDLGEARMAARRRAVPYAWLFNIPWWGVALLLFGINFLFIVTINYFGGFRLDLAPITSYQITFLDDPYYRYVDVIGRLTDGVSTTLRVSLWAYGMGLLIALVVALLRVNPPRSPEPGAPPGKQARSLLHLVFYNLATLYVEVLRGLPILVVLLMVAFVAVPMLNNTINQLAGATVLDISGTSEQSAIMALALTYGAFLSETLRAGIQSIEKGQLEAARSLGMNYRVTLTQIILPQAIRRVLPPLGNDMVAMIKDSSLVSALGVRDLTQLSKLNASSNFWYLETFGTAAVIYLTLTILGTRLVRLLERRLKTHER